MKILTLDSSTKTFSLAVSDGEKILKSKNTKLKKVLSSSIIPAIRKILDETGLTLTKLDAFAVGLGPGSFTSLRVGLSTVKGLAFALNKPVIGIPSLDALALNVRDFRVKQVCSISDAKRNLVYACFYDVRGSAFKRTSQYLLVEPKKILDRITKETVLVGDGIPVMKEFLKQLKDTVSVKSRIGKISFAPEKSWHPRAAELAILAWEKFKRQEFADINQLVPVYLYPEHCQVEKKK